jgi:hypothetical protein
MDLYEFCSLGFGSVLGIRIRIQEQGNLPNLTNKPDFQPFKNGFCTTYIRYIFHVKTHLFVTAKFDLDLESHSAWIRIGLAPFDPDPHPY